MRLLNTRTHTLREFIGSDIPPYAILSHTWEQEEVLFADIQNDIASSKKGHAKLLGCCSKALSHGFQWVWIDTCCIDKSSSAELSEAINSMYRWYEASNVCYAYLQDVEIASDKLKSRRHTWYKPVSYSELVLEKLSESRWFTRGWTLQELLAPKVVEFYSYEWLEIGTKTSLAYDLSLVTSIPDYVLCGKDLLRRSVAERMSWASSRRTTREEDMAYCLLGLFNVNMPLLYGEGKKAFIRLQEQILKQNEDYSIFAWTLQSDCGQSLTGFLASSPSEYSKEVPNYLLPQAKYEPWNDKAADSGSIDVSSKLAEAHTFARGLSGFPTPYSIPHKKNYESLAMVQLLKSRLLPSNPPEITSRGIRVSLPVVRSASSSLVLAWLYCDMDDRLLCIGLQPISESTLRVYSRDTSAISETSARVYARDSSTWLISVHPSTENQFTVEELLLFPHGLIAEAVTRPSDLAMAPHGDVWGRLRVVGSGTGDLSCYAVSSYPVDRWSLDEFFFKEKPYLIGVVMLECADNAQSFRFELCCGIQDGHPWCAISEELSSQFGEEVDDLSEFYQNHLQYYERAEFTPSDRAARRSGRMAGVTLTAAIRKDASSHGQTLVYVVHVKVMGPDSCDPWVRLYINE